MIDTIIRKWLIPASSISSFHVLMTDKQDIVAHWSVPVHDRIYEIEFEHGTASGKRVIRVDGKEILRRNWMFSLVGKEIFDIGKFKCVINVEALGTFLYEYTLEVNDKGTMDIWVNGQKMNTAGEFLEDGTKTHFEIGRNVCYVKATSSGNKKLGFIYQLYINNNEIITSDK
uniref:Bm2747 n=1 Tax=Brugia malayi TaxID=6279 RepID=A0A0H5RZF2_BRUMA|nr:Bm2747 [Brugia malayi]